MARGGRERGETHRGAIGVCARNGVEMTSEVKDAEGRVEDSAEIRELEERLAELEAEKNELEAAAAAKESTVAELEAKLTAIQDEALVLRERKAQVMAAQKKVSPKVEYSLSLFAEISNIEWDYAAETVKGIVAAKDGMTTKPFNLNPSHHSMFFITNYLWEIVPDA